MQPDSMDNVRKDFAWAVEIVRKRFADGLEELCDSEFLDQRYQRFKDRDDPIYAELLAAMQDEALAKTFVSYWTIAHTLATMSRFWLDEAIADLIIHQARHFGRPATEVYSQSMLGHGYLERRVTIAQMGEEERENLSRRLTWRPLVQRSSLDQIDLIVGRRERERAARTAQPKTHPSPSPRFSTPEARREDFEDLAAAAGSLKGPPADPIAIQCNLLVIEPDRLNGKPHAWAFRFVNPKVMGRHADRKQERANLLRLYAYLVQEKILRDPKGIQVAVAEVVPRYSEFDPSIGHPDFFSPVTYWKSHDLWGNIGVPFEVVTAAIHDVAEEFRGKLISGLRGLLPKDEAPLQQGLFDDEEEI